MECRENLDVYEKERAVIFEGSVINRSEGQSSEQMNDSKISIKSFRKLLRHRGADIQVFQLFLNDNSDSRKILAKENS